MAELPRLAGGTGTEKLVSQFLAHEKPIRRFVRTLVFNKDDADEVFQAATVTMLEKFDTLDAEADFGRWARRIVVFKVLELIQKRKRDRLRFGSEATLQALARDAGEMSDSLAARSLALEKCLRQLLPQNRKILADRYERGESVEVIAATMRRTVRGIYQALARSRKALHDCITQSIDKPEAAS